MATAQENLARFQEIANRGLQDQLPPEIRARFDESVKRGLVVVSDQPFSIPADRELETRKIQQQIASEVGPVKSALIATGRGIADVGRAVGLADEETERERIGLAQLQEQRPVTQIGGRAAGQTLPFLPAAGPVGAIASTPLRATAAAGLGGLEGAAIAAGTGQDVAEGSAIGGTLAGAFELVFPVLGRVGRQLINSVRGRPPTAPVITKGGVPSQELQNAMDAAGLTIDDLSRQAQEILQFGDVQDAASLARRDFLERQGITPTRAQITGDVTEFQRQQELFKNSGPVRAALDAQESAIQGRFDNAVTATGGSANPSSSTAFDYIADRSIDQDAAVSSAYNAAREAAGDQKIIRVSNLASILRKSKDFEKVTGGLPSAVRGILRNRGLIDSKGKLITSTRKTQRELDKFRDLLSKKGLRELDNGEVINSLGAVARKETEKLDNLKDANTGRLLNVSEAEAIRQDMNSLFDSLTENGKKRLRSFKNALDNDVSLAVGDDIFADARAAKTKFESELERTKVNKFDKRNFNLVRNILENKVNPDNFLQEAVLSKKIRAEDISQLKDFLLLDGSDAGTAAWNDLRAEAMSHIRDKAINVVENQPFITRNRLEKAIESIGTQKLKAIFTPDENRFLRDMLKVTRLREPKAGTALGQGPTAAAVNELKRTFQKSSFLGDLFSGLAVNARGAISIRPPRVERVIQPTPARAVVPAAGLGLMSEEEQETN